VFSFCGAGGTSGNFEICNVTFMISKYRLIILAERDFDQVSHTAFERGTFAMYSKCDLSVI